MLKKAQQKNRLKFEDKDEIRYDSSRLIPFFYYEAFLDLNKLQTFYIVALKGGYQQASEVLGIYYTAISRQVKSLEKELGCALVKKYNRGVTLTPEGQELFSFAAKFLKEAKLVTDNLKNKSQEQKKSIKILTTQGLAAADLPRSVANFAHLYPETYIELSTASNFVSSADYTFDVYVAPINFKEEGFVYHLLTEFNFSLYASPDYLKKYGYPKSLSDLNNHRLIGFAVGENRPFSETNQLMQLESSDKYRIPYISVDSSIGEIILTDSGVGIASICDDHPFLKTTSLIRIFPDMEPLKIKVYYVCHEHLDSQPIFQHLLHILKEDFSKFRKISPWVMKSRKKIA